MFYFTKVFMDDFRRSSAPMGHLRDCDGGPAGSRGGLFFMQHILRYFRLLGRARYSDGDDGARIVVAKERDQRLEQR
jgi:hypothetical protein